LAAFVLKGEKHSIIFCPFSLIAYTVKSNCDEIEKAIDPESFNEDWMLNYMNENWATHQRYGWQSNYDIAVKIFTILGAKIPEQVKTGGEVDTRKKGGKPMADTLTKPVKLNSKRGKFLKFVMDRENSAEVLACMIEFDTTRSNVLSYFFQLNKDHGIGYELIGGTASIQLPQKWPFDTEPEMEDDSWYLIGIM